MEIETIVLHWQEHRNRWRRVEWDDFLAFREISQPFRPLEEVAAGIHYFDVCVCDEGKTHNIIPHKYLVEPNGKIGPANFSGWNREERIDYERLMVAAEIKEGEKDLLREIQRKGAHSMFPPAQAIVYLALALPYPLEDDSAAFEFFSLVTQ